MEKRFRVVIAKITHVDYVETIYQLVSGNRLIVKRKNNCNEMYVLPRTTYPGRLVRVWYIHNDPVPINPENMQHMYIGEK